MSVRGKEMIVPAIVGVLCAKYGRDMGNAKSWALGIGLVMGIVSGLHIVPLAYPFYALVTHTTSTSMGTFFNIEAYFLWGESRLWSGGVIDHIWLSPLIPFLFIPVCMLGSYVGLLFGSRRYHPFPTEVWSSKPK